MKGSAQKKLTTGRVRTPFGAIKVTQGLPASRAEIDKIFQQLDFQQASQAYLWALPLVSWAEWQATQAETFGATDHDIVLYTNYAERLGILTANATTPYMVAFFDLKKSGPMVIELPPGRSRAACPTSGSARASPWARWAPTGGPVAGRS